MDQVPPPAMNAIEFMGLGLEIGRHTQWRTYKHEANIKRFKEAFGMLCGIPWMQFLGHQPEGIIIIDVSVHH
jgi:hypothetical protein